MKKTTTIQIKGVDYQAEPAIIQRSFLGLEDHGALVSYLTFEGPGWRQSEPPRTRSDRDFKAYFRTVLATLRISDWDSVVGQHVFVLRAEGSGYIVGFTHRLEDRYMFFDPELAKAESEIEVIP